MDRQVDGVSQSSGVFYSQYPKKIVELIVPVLIYNSLHSGSRLSLSHLGDGLLHTFSLLLVLALNKKVVGLSGFGYEVLVLGKQELEIDS